MLRATVQSRSRAAMTTFTSISAPSHPLITIIGATGTGKSELAVALARRFNGEVINGDAMQLYDGLPIITNKIKPHERQNVPHHLLGCVGLDEPPWTAAQYTREAGRVMQEIRSRGRLPILVGGTHYYIQSLLFKDVEGSEKDSSFNPEKSEGNMTREELESRFPILKASTEEMLARLKEVDPVMASRWHPHDRRRLQRSLEIYLLTGRRASDLYNAQRNGHSKEPDSTKIPKTETSTPDKNEDEDMASQLLGVPRGQTVNAPSLILWIHVPQSTLNARLDKRVERMVQDGLLSEVESLDEYLQMKESKGKSIKRDTGIWVSIGFKEFASYLSACKTHKNNTNEDGSTESLESLKQTAIERIQIATRQYAKRQIRWIRIKLLHALAATNMTNHLFVLDGSDTTQWTQNVVGPSEEIVEKYLAGTPLPKPAEIYPDAEQLLHPKSEVDLSLSPEKWIRRECELCGTTTVTEEDWSRHVNSKGHKKVVKSRRKKQERDAAIEQPRDAEQSDELGKIE